MAERFKAPVLKTGVHSVDREFESRPLRQFNTVRREEVRSELKLCNCSLLTAHCSLICGEMAEWSKAHAC